MDASVYKSLTLRSLQKAHICERQNMREDNGPKWTTKEGQNNLLFEPGGKKQNIKGGQKWICYTFLALRDILAADKLDQ